MLPMYIEILFNKIKEKIPSVWSKLTINERYDVSFYQGKGDKKMNIKNIRLLRINKKINFGIVLLISFSLLTANLSPVNAWVISSSQTMSGSSSYGGSGNDQGNALVEVRGFLYSTGTFEGNASFGDTTNPSLNLTSNGGKDIYISKVDPSYGNILWVKGIGGPLNDQGLSITGFDMPPGGNDLYITGTFEGTVDFDPGIGVANLTSAGGSDIFILNLDLNGNFQWVKRLWGTANSQASSITLTSNSSGVTNIYITGFFEGKVDFNPNATTYYLTSAGRSDIFVLNLTVAGNFVWAKRIGGPGSDVAYSVGNHGSANSFIHITGTFESTVDFNPAAAVANLTADSNGDTFILKLSTAGGFLWSKKLGGMTTPIGSSGGPRFIFNKCDTSSTQGTYIVGSFEGREDFDPHLTNVLKLTSLGGRDVFLAKLSSTGTLIWAKSFGGFGNDQGQAISFGEDCLYPAIYATGSFEDKVDFNPSQNITNLTSIGSTDIFVTKFDINGQHLWAKQFGGPDEDTGYAIVNRGSYMYSTGSFNSIANFHLNGPQNTLTSAGGEDLFLSALNQSGN